MQKHKIQKLKNTKIAIMKKKEIPRECLGWGMQIMSVLVAEINHRSLRLGTESRNRIDAQTVYTRVSFACHGNSMIHICTIGNRNTRVHFWIFEHLYIYISILILSRATGLMPNSLYTRVSFAYHGMYVWYIYVQ